MKLVLVPLGKEFESSSVLPVKSSTVLRVLLAGLEKDIGLSLSKGKEVSVALLKSSSMMGGVETPMELVVIWTIPPAAYREEESKESGRPRAKKEAHAA